MRTSDDSGPSITADNLFGGRPNYFSYLFFLDAFDMIWFKLRTQVRRLGSVFTTFICVLAGYRGFRVTVSMDQLTVISSFQYLSSPLITRYVKKIMVFWLNPFHYLI